MRGETGPDFIEALARGLDVIRASGPNRPVMSLSEVAAATELARPTARRMLLTLEELGYVRVTQGGFALTPRVLELGMAHIGSASIWDIARPHMERLASQAAPASRRSGNQEWQSETGFSPRCAREDGRSPTNTWRAVFARLPRPCTMV